MSPQESIKFFQKDLANEGKLLHSLESESQTARARHDKALANFESAQKVISASQAMVDSTRDAYVNAVEQHGAQMGKVNKLRGQLAAAGGQLNHGNVDDAALRRAEENQRAAEAKIAQPA